MISVPTPTEVDSHEVKLATKKWWKHEGWLENVEISAYFKVLSIQGPQGPRGPAGTEGPEGPEGSRGPRGPAGPPSITPAEIDELKSRIEELEDKLSELLGPASSPGMVSVPAGGSRTIGVKETAVTELTTYATRTIEGTVKVQTLKERPVGLVKAAAPKVVYQYLYIISEDIAPEDVEKVDIEFKVEKTWISDESIEMGTITLYRYSARANEWAPLPTEKVGEDAAYVYFKAESPGLSVFAIIGERVKPFPWTIVAAVVITIVVIVAVVSTLYFRRR